MGRKEGYCWNWKLGPYTPTGLPSHVSGFILPSHGWGALCTSHETWSTIPSLCVHALATEQLNESSPHSNSSCTGPLDEETGVPYVTPYGEYAPTPGLDDCDSLVYMPTGNAPITCAWREGAGPRKEGLGVNPEGVTKGWFINLWWSRETSGAGNYGW